MRSWWWGFSCRLSPAAEQKVGGWFHTSPSLLPNSRPPRVLLPGFLVLHPGFANGNNLHRREKSSSKLNASLVSFLGWVSNHFLLSPSCWLFSCSLQRIPCVCIIFPSTAEQWKSNSNPKTQPKPNHKTLLGDFCWPKRSPRARWGNTERLLVAPPQFLCDQEFKHLLSPVLGGSGSRSAASQVQLLLMGKTLRCSLCLLRLVALMLLSA